MNWKDKIELPTDKQYNKFINDIIEIDTIFGVMKYKTAFGELIQDVYRFIYCYGSKLQVHGMNERIKLTKTKEQ